MGFDINKITDYEAVCLLNYYPCFSNKTQQFITVHIREILKKAENNLKVIILPKHPYLHQVDMSTYKVDRDNATIQEKYSWFVYQIKNFISSHENISGVKNLSNFYRFLLEKILHAPCETNEDLYNIIKAIRPQMSILTGEENKSGLFAVLEALNLMFQLLIYKAEAIGVYMSLYSGIEYNYSFNYRGELIKNIFDCVGRYRVEKHHGATCGTLVTMLYHNSGRDPDDMIELIKTYLFIKKRLNEVEHIEDIEVDFNSDFMKALLQLPNYREGCMRRSEPIIYGDTEYFANYRKNNIMNFVLHHERPRYINLNVSEKLLSGFFGHYKNNYKRLGFYDGVNNITIICIDGKSYLLTEDTRSNTIRMIELNLDEFKTGNHFTVDTPDEYRLEVGELV